MWGQFWGRILQPLVTMIVSEEAGGGQRLGRGETDFSPSFAPFEPVWLTNSQANDLPVQRADLVFRITQADTGT